MHPHRSPWRQRARGLLLSLLLTPSLAVATPGGYGPASLDAAPQLSGSWYPSYSPFAVGGFYAVTFNTQHVATSTAVWRVILPQDGLYQVFVSSVPSLTLPRTSNARYEVTTATGTQLVGGIDQNFLGEQLLGIFPMAAGANGVRLTNLTGEPQLSRSVVANAVRWELVAAGPVPPPPPTPPPGTPFVSGYLDFYGKPVIAAPPGSPVIITGSFGFSGTVQFAGFPAPIVRWSPTAIRVLTPLTGSYPTRGPVTVTTAEGTVSGPEFTIDPNAPQPQPAPPPPPPPPVFPFFPGDFVFGPYPGGELPGFPPTQYQLPTQYQYPF
jgi:hypothetical protein